MWRTGLAFSDGDVGRGVGRAGVVGARTDEAVVVVLLDDVGGPAGDAADGEDGSEEVDVDAERGVGGGGVEVDVGVELLLLLDEELDLAGHVEPLGVAGGFAEFFGHAAEVGRAGIFGVVDAMAEAGDFFLLGEHLA